MNATLLAPRTSVVAPLPTVAAVARADADLLLDLCREHAALDGRGAAPSRGLLEFHEALFDPPLRAWAWLGLVDGAVVGYAAATVGFSWPDQGYRFQLDALYVRASWQEWGVERALFGEVRAMAQRLGCVQLQWNAGAADVAAHRFDRDAHAAESVRYSLPLPAKAG